MRHLFQHIRLLPILIVFLALSFGVRLNAFFTGVDASSGVAYAEESTAPPAGELEEDSRTVQTMYDTPQGEEDEEGEKYSMQKQSDNKMMGAPPPRSENWRDSSDEDFEFSDVRMELFEDLSRRRAEIEEQEKELNMREALLKAAEQELDQKYRELLSLREEIQGLLVQQSEEETERIASLVKIYEGMKAKDAARIFNTLDLDVLLQVLSRMSERKSAPVLAAMTPDRARTVTIMLAEQKALPEAESFIQQ